MRCWILIQIWTFFALQTPQDALGLSFVGCRRVITHTARDNQPEWIAAGSAAGHFPLSMGYIRTSGSTTAKLHADLDDAAILRAGGIRQAIHFSWKKNAQPYLDPMMPLLPRAAD
jgi:hypothetical protein